MRLIPDNNSNVRETKSSSNGTVTLWRDSHEVEHSLFAGVTVGAEQQSLDADLDPLRFPGPLWQVGVLPCL